MLIKLFFWIFNYQSLHSFSICITSLVFTFQSIFWPLWILLLQALHSTSLTDFNFRQSYVLSKGIPYVLSLIFAYSQFILLANLKHPYLLGGLLYKPYGHAYRNYIHIPETLRLLVRIHRLNLLRPASLVWLLHKFKPLMRSPKTTVLENYNIIDFTRSIAFKNICRDSRTRTYDYQIMSLGL